MGTNDSGMPPLVRRRCLEASLTLAGTVASFCILYGLAVAWHAQSQPAVIAAVLSIGLGRRENALSLREGLVACARLTLVAIGAAAVGILLHVAPVAGAIVFVAGIFASVWLRDFGARGRAIGQMIALPLVAILIVPGPRTPAPGGAQIDIILVVLAGIVAYTCFAVIRRSASGVGLVAVSRGAGDDREAVQSPAPASGRMSVTLRMAIQMAIALSVAFALGFVLFPRHWGWVVLTAFIVCIGARGRGDALYKAILRLIGAVAGTLAAAALGHLWSPSGVLEAVTIFAVLFAGLALRDVNYAYWACSTTLILALLARTGPNAGVGLLESRLEAILVGALCAVAATWFVYPIRTDAVVRRRLADALLALDDLVANMHLEQSESATKRARFERRIAALHEVAPPLVWHRRLFARRDLQNHPALWLDLAANVRDRARDFGVTSPPAEITKTKIRRAIGLSRRAIADHARPKAERGQSVASALHALHATFDAESTRQA